MLNENEIEELKNKLDSNGKLIITDDMPQKVKERYEFINSQNLNLTEVLSRKINLNSNDDVDEDAIETLNDNDSEYDESDNDNEIIDTGDDNISEDDSVSVEDLENFF